MEVISVAIIEEMIAFQRGRGDRLSTGLCCKKETDLVQLGEKQNKEDPP
jgi:hypothetical protein